MINNNQVYIQVQTMNSQLKLYKKTVRLKGKNKPFDFFFLRSFFIKNFFSLTLVVRLTAN